jgi:MFS superfamily sulfate permease-like transporter
VSSAIVTALLAVATPAFYFLPKAVLAAMVIAAISALIDVGGAKRLWRTSRFDLLVMAAAFFGTLVLGTQTGILIAIVVSIALFVSGSARPRISVIGRVAQSVQYVDLDSPLRPMRIPGVQLVRFHAPLFFANSGMLKEFIVELLRSRKDPRSTHQWGVLVLDCSAMTMIDSTSVQVLQEIADAVANAGVRLLLACVNKPVWLALKRMKFLDKLGEDSCLDSVHDAAVAGAKEWSTITRKSTSSLRSMHTPTPTPTPTPAMPTIAAAASTGRTSSDVEIGMSVDQ